MSIFALIAAFWLGLVLGLLAGLFLRPPTEAERWRESAEYRRHVGEPAEPWEQS